MICRNCGRATCPTLTMPPVVRVIGNLKVSGGNEGAQRRVALKDCRAHAVDWFDRAQALQAELDALREKDRWIPVGERLPQSDGMTVLTEIGRAHV